MQINCTSVKFILFFVLVTYSITSNAQSLFFDHIKGSEWWMEEAFTDSVTFAQEEIALASMVKTKTISPAFDLWMFNDDLHIYRYDSISKSLSTVRVLRYEIIEEKAKTYIRIFPSYTQEYVDYEVGIASTGNLIVLIKQQERKKK